jgi:hypothetical protein
LKLGLAYGVGKTQIPNGLSYLLSPGFQALGTDTGQKHAERIFREPGDQTLRAGCLVYGLGRLLEDAVPEGVAPVAVQAGHILNIYDQEAEIWTSARVFH